MHSTSIIDRLDRNIDALVAGAASVPERGDELLDQLTELSRELRMLPSGGFQQRLLASLDRRAAHLQHEPMTEAQRVLVLGHRISHPATPELILPTLFTAGTDSHRTRNSFALSVAAHAVVLALLLTSGVWMRKHPELVKLSSSQVTEISTYIPPVASAEAHGGGGGGDHSKLAASEGALPKASLEQITPPMIVRNESPKLTAVPTVVLTPNLTLPQLAPLGDPKAHLGAPSNGTGIGGGMGSGKGDGIGSGRGPGVGTGEGGGFGGGVFKVGGGVSAPRPIYDPDPDYSEEARKAHWQGAVVLSIVVGPDGKVHDARVARSLGLGLDEKALDAVRKWKFEPARKDGKPVAVQVNVEVYFHLY